MAEELSVNFKMKKEQGSETTPECQHCGDRSEDTALHTLVECPVWARQREDLIAALGVVSLSLETVVHEIVSSGSKWDATATFCEQVMLAKEAAEKIMKKSKLNTGAAKKNTTKVEEEQPANPEQTPTKVDSLDDEEQGFGGWLRSSDGMETMKLFVIANSIVMLTTLVYPHIEVVFQIVSDMIYGTEILYDD